jgi:hypothetical protein
MNTAPDFSLSHPSGLLNDVELMRQEIARMQVENDDLRASARLWRHLYESALRRAADLHASSKEQRAIQPQLSDRLSMRWHQADAPPAPMPQGADTSKPLSAA